MTTLIFPIFNIDITSSETANCKLVNYVKDTERINDTEVYVKYDNNFKYINDTTIDLKTIRNYWITAKLCKCNIPNSYLTSKNEYPIYYLTLLYQSNLLGGALFNIFLKFVSNTDIKENIKHMEKTKDMKKISKMINTYKIQMTGSYKIYIDEDINQEEFYLFMKENVKKTMIKNKVNDLKTATDEEKKNIFNEIEKNIEIEMEKAKEYFKEKEIKNEMTEKQMLLELINYIKNPTTEQLILYILNEREKEKKEKYPNFYNSDILERKTTNLKDIIENPDSVYQ